MSLGSQTADNFEVIVVDDNDDAGWNEKVLAVVEDFQKSFENLTVRYIRNSPNVSAAVSRNNGAKTARGRYLTFLDDDDEYLPEKIASQSAFMEEGGYDFSVTDIALYYDDGRLSHVRKRSYIKSYENEMLLKYHLKYSISATDTIMMKTAFFHEIGGFDDMRVGEEFHLTLKAILSNGKFGHLNRCDVKAYIHSGDEGLSSGESKLNAENLTYSIKKRYFSRLSKSDIRYINMRHNAVIAFAYIRLKKIMKFLKYSMKAFFCAPVQMFKMVVSGE